MKPECIVLDEPTAMLDPMGRKTILNTVKDLNQREGVTTIYVTHFMEEAIEADRVVVLSEGQIVLMGKPREVFSRVQTIKALKLDVPEMTELAYELTREGLALTTDILTVEEMVQSLVAYSLDG